MKTSKSKAGLGSIVTLIPGDGIGVEITGAVVKILEAAGIPFGPSMVASWNARARMACRVSSPLLTDLIIERSFVLSTVRKLTSDH